MKFDINKILDDKEYFNKAYTFYSKNGYLISNIIKIDLVDKINLNIEKHIKQKKALKTNPKIFNYNESPRIVEIWKEIPEVKELAVSDNIIKLLELLYLKKPIPFSTINFLKGTEQPQHSDYFHFATKPDGYLAGVWTALEDIDKNSGPLTIIPESHKLPYVWLDSLNLNIPKNKKDIKENYTVYENYIKKIIINNKLKPYTPELKKGDFLIWSANLLHGAGKINNKNTSRLSQVTHYHFEDCELYFNPLFSRIDQKKYGIRDLNKIRIPYE